MSTVSVSSDWTWQRYNDHGYWDAEFDVAPDFGWRRIRVLDAGEELVVSTEWHFGLAHPDSVQEDKLRVIHAERGSDVA